MASQGELLKHFLESQEAESDLQFEANKITKQNEFTTSLQLAQLQRKNQKAQRKLKVNSMLKGEKELAAAEKARQAEEQAQQTNQPAVARPATMSATAPSGGMMQFGLKGGGGIGRTSTGAPGGGGPQPNAKPDITISQAPGQHFGQTTTRRVSREPAGGLQLGPIGLNFTRPQVTESTETDQTKIDTAISTAVMIAGSRGENSPELETFMQTINTQATPEVAKRIQDETALGIQAQNAKRNAELPVRAKTLVETFTRSDGTPITTTEAAEIESLRYSNTKEYYAELDDLRSIQGDTNRFIRDSREKEAETHAHNLRVAKRDAGIAENRAAEQVEINEDFEKFYNSPVNSRISRALGSVADDVFAMVAQDRRVVLPGAPRTSKENEALALTQADLGDKASGYTIVLDEGGEKITQAVNPASRNLFDAISIIKDGLWVWSEYPEVKKSWTDSLPTQGATVGRYKETYTTTEEIINMGRAFNPNIKMDKGARDRAIKRAVDKGFVIETSDGSFTMPHLDPSQPQDNQLRSLRIASFWAQSQDLDTQMAFIMQTSEEAARKKRLADEAAAAAGGPEVPQTPPHNGVDDANFVLKNFPHLAGELSSRMNAWVGDRVSGPIQYTEAFLETIGEGLVQKSAQSAVDRGFVTETPEGLTFDPDRGNRAAAGQEQDTVLPPANPGEQAKARSMQRKENLEKRLQQRWSSNPNIPSLSRER